MKHKFHIPRRFRGKAFDNYEPNQDNQKAFEVVREYAKTFDERFGEGDWLVLTGNYGLGKTHLALAVAKYTLKFFAKQFVDNNPQAYNRLEMNCPIIFRTATELIENIRDCYENDMKSEEKVMTHFKTVKLLIIDDLGTEKASEWHREKMYSILDYRYRELKTTIITTNLEAGRLRNHISERIVERMIEAGGEYMRGFQGESYRRSDTNV